VHDLCTRPVAGRYDSNIQPQYVYRTRWNINPFFTKAGTRHPRSRKPASLLFPESVLPSCHVGTAAWLRRGGIAIPITEIAKTGTSSSSIQRASREPKRGSTLRLAGRGARRRDFRLRQRFRGCTTGRAKWVLLNFCTS